MPKHITAIIQARMGSTRLPGKVMLSLNSRLVLEHVLTRSEQSRVVDEVMVATSTKPENDIIENTTSRLGFNCWRGNESDVLGRIYEAAENANSDCIVRITADCPLIDPGTIDEVVKTLQRMGADYSSNIGKRTFPRGLDVEAFTFESFERVHEKATDSHHREHVTPYYRENSDEFDVVNVASEEVFDDPQFRDRSDLRLTLDEADDYEVLREVYENVDYDRILPVRDAIRYVDDHDLMSLNESVEQKEV